MPGEPGRHINRDGLAYVSVKETFEVKFELGSSTTSNVEMLTTELWG